MPRGLSKQFGRLPRAYWLSEREKNLLFLGKNITRYLYAYVSLWLTRIGCMMHTWAHIVKAVNSAQITTHNCPFRIFVSSCYIVPFFYVYSLMNLMYWSETTQPCRSCIFACWIWRHWWKRSEVDLWVVWLQEGLQSIHHTGVSRRCIVPSAKCTIPRNRCGYVPMCLYLCMCACMLVWKI